VKTPCKAFRIILLTALLSLPSFIHAATLFEDFNTHKWYDPGWGTRMLVIQNAPFLGKDCLYIDTQSDQNSALIICKNVADEDWSDIDLIKMDVYCQSPAKNDLRIEIKDRADTTLNSTVEPQYVRNVATSTWVDCTWDVNNIASPVSWLVITMDGLGANACTYYFDNIRLVKQDGTTWYWDTFDTQLRNWDYGGSTITWNSNFPGVGVVSHNDSTSTVNAGAGYLRWQYYGPDRSAELKLAGESLDWTGFGYVKADVWCSTTTTPVWFFLWYETIEDGRGTDVRYVSSPEKWETLYWPLPSATTAYHVKEVMPGVLPNQLFPSGTFYIDNITLVPALRISKGKSPATALKPGGDATITLTYSNPSNEVLTNAYITEAIPYNTYLPQAPATGHADSVEYYVNGVWQATFNQGASKIRWKDNNVAAASSGLSVSYILRIK